MVYDPARTYAQIKEDEEVPDIIISATHVTTIRDVRDEPATEEQPAPEGYKMISYLTHVVPKAEWEAERASFDDVADAKDDAIISAWDMILAANAAGGDGA